MNILIVNCGSSSQNFRIYQIGQEKEPNILLNGKARNVATKTEESSRIDYFLGGENKSLEMPLPSHRAVAEACL